jgi:hypothetical protein
MVPLTTTRLWVVIDPLSAKLAVYEERAGSPFGVVEDNDVSIVLTFVQDGGLVVLSRTPAMTTSFLALTSPTMDDHFS